MNEQKFWQIIAETHDTSMDEQGKKLIKRLIRLPEEEIIEFDRLSTLKYWELYTWELWGVAYLYWGACSDDGFMDWMNWVVYCGKEAFETARDYPDNLVPVIDSHPDAGCEGIGYTPMKALRKKNPKWEDAHPDFDIERPDKPTGANWENEDDLKKLLPKTFKRYEEDASEEELNMKDPNYVIEKFNITIGGPVEFKLNLEGTEIDGQKAQKAELKPVKSKPWWKFW